MIVCDTRGTVSIDRTTSEAAKPRIVSEAGVRDVAAFTLEPDIAVFG